MPDIVGDCLTTAWDDPNRGGVVQLTSRGTLVWRQADDSTFFTDGLSVWSGDPARPGPYPLDEALLGVGAGDTPGARPAGGQGARQRADLLVNSADDAPDADPGDGTCATEAGRCTVRAAIVGANATDGPRRVSVPAGVFKLGIEGPGEDRPETGEDPGDCRLIGDTTGNLLGDDPRMGQLIEDGPRAGSRDLLPDSPVIDAGTNDGCPVDDLRHAPRPRDGRGTGQATCDLGAIEYQRE